MARDSFKAVSEGNYFLAVGAIVGVEQLWWAVTTISAKSQQKC